VKLVAFAALVLVASGAPQYTMVFGVQGVNGRALLITPYPTPINGIMRPVYTIDLPTTWVDLCDDSGSCWSYPPPRIEDIA
jgi:hypothetical protein